MDKYVLIGYDFLKPTEEELQTAKKEFMYYENHKPYGYHLQKVIDSVKIYGEIFALMEIRFGGKNCLVVGDLSYIPEIVHIEKKDLKDKKWIGFLPQRGRNGFYELLDEYCNKEIENEN